MKIVPLTDEMRYMANEKSDALGEIRNSIRHGEGNYVGYLGEEAIAAYLGANLMSCEDGEAKYSHDLVLLSGEKAEVKTKKRRVPPRDFYKAAVAETSRHQRPDVYIFMSYDELRDEMWVVGQKGYMEFYAKARYVPEGSEDASNTWRSPSAHYAIEHRDLDEVVVRPHQMEMDGIIALGMKLMEGE